MARVSIKIIGDWTAWDTRARRAQLVREDGSTAEVLLHPGQGGPPLSLEQARAEGRLISAARHPVALHLKQVTLVGEAPMWVYDGFPGASLARLGQELLALGRRLPLRVVLEAGVAVVDALGELGSPSQGVDGRLVVHPGPTPGMVLLGRDGQVKVAGFRAPPAGVRLEAPAGYGAPEGGQAPAAQVYAMGALLAELLGGEPPPSAVPDAERHAAMVRRALIRVVARPGTRIPDPVVELVRECLTFAPAGRPSLPRLSVRLSRLASELPQDDLLTWARDALPAVWSRLGPTVAGETPPMRPLPMQVGRAPLEGVGLDLDPGLAPPTEAATGRRRGLSPDALTETAARAGARGGVVDGELLSSGHSGGHAGGLAGELGAESDTEEDLEEERTEELKELPPDRTEGPAPVAPSAAALSAVAPSAAAPSAAAPSAAAPSTAAPSAAASGPGPRPRPRTSSARVEAVGQASGAADASGVGDPGAGDAPTVVSAGPAPGSGPAVGPARPLSDAGPMLVIGSVDPEPDDAADAEWRPRRRWSQGWLAVGVGVLLLGVAGAWWVLRDPPLAPTVTPPAVDVASLDAALGDPPLGPGFDDASTDGAAASTDGAAASPADAAASPGEASASPAVAAASAPEAAASPAVAVAPPSEATSSPVGTASPARTVPAREQATARVADEQQAARAADAATAAATALAPTPTPEPVVEPIVVTIPAPAPQAPPYTLRFSSAYASVQRLAVQCHGGRSGSGAVVTIPDAVPGPCRVEGTTVDGGRLVALVSAVGDQSWRCFEGGERSCR